MFHTTTKKLTNEFISANLFGILFFFVYCNVELDDGFSTLFFSYILFFITEMWFLSLVSMHEGVFTNDYLSDDFFGILFCHY